MDNIETLKWGALLSTIGIAFGWFLNQVTGWWRVRRDDKRILKQVLYNLLEIHHLLGRFEIDESVDKILDRILQTLSPDENTEENRAILKKVIYREAATFFKDVTADDLKKFETNYQNSIVELSKIEPIRAYYLSDKTNIPDKIKLIESWIANVYDKFPSDENEKEITKKEMSSLLSPNIMSDTLNDLRIEMRGIAWKINPVTWIKIKQILKKSNYSNVEWENRIEETIAKIIRQVQQHSK